jgi:hypothetical protein
MIGQYLSDTNESARVSILPNILELNKALLHNHNGTYVGCANYLCPKWHTAKKSQPMAVWSGDA